MTFSGKLLVCPLNTTVKSPQISQWRKSFYSRWPPWPLVAYCYTLKSCKFLNICYRKTLLGCIPMFWKTENTVESLFQRISTLQVKIQYGGHYKANFINDIRMESLSAYFQDGCHTYSRNENLHNSMINRLIFMILVSNVWFSGCWIHYRGQKIV